MTLRVAIVDDNSFLIHAVKEKLSFFEDVTVKHTSLNGSELLSKLEENHNIDLILMDIEMPVLDGIETTQVVKQKYPQIKIIMLTAFDNDENIFNAIKAGADGYLLKEINPKDLYEGIKETLNGGAAMNPSIALKTLKLLQSEELLLVLEQFQPTQSFLKFYYQRPFLFHLVELLLIQLADYLQQ